MASVSAPPFSSSSQHIDPNPRNLPFRNPKFLVSSSRHSLPLKKSSVHPTTFPSIFRVSESALCRCQNQSDPLSSPEDYVHQRWDFQFQDFVKSSIKRFEDYMNSLRNPLKNDSSVNVTEEKKEVEVEDWDWNRWKKHFDEVEEQERIVSILKAQLGEAIRREDYDDAAKLKVAIAAAATNDTVSRVICHLNRAIEEERYQDAAFIRDHACTGLVGWWAGISEESDDPYGRIICIRAEHGRYVARSYSPRHLATGTPGVPLFEIFLTMSSNCEYKQQVVYLKRKGSSPGDSPVKLSNSSDPSSRLNPLNESTEGKSGLSATSTEDIEDRDDDSDVAEGMSGFQNILRDMIPGVKVTVLEVVTPEKDDSDLVSNVIEHIMEEEDEDKDLELGSVDTDDEGSVESLQNQDDIELDLGDGITDNSDKRTEMAVKVVIGGAEKNLSSNVPSKRLLRVPARLEKKDRLSFSFSIEKNDSQQEAGGEGQVSPDKNSNLRGQRSIKHAMTDLAKFIINREKIPMKVLKDVEDLINLTLSQAQNRQPLSGTTIFNRIEIPPYPDLLNGLYVGAHGLHTSEVIHLRRKFGQWQEDGMKQKHTNIGFYEYVEALKLTGDPYVPAGQVAFRAKVGKQYQLPHKGIIPEEFGVVARYKGQGRLAEPGFRNPRWVDGELVILDGKYIKGGPVVGFVYWAPDYHFLVFFNRLRLQD